MRRLLLIVVVLLITVVCAATWWLSRPGFHRNLPDDPFAGMDIAPLEQALTLARTRSGDVVVVLQATSAGVIGASLQSGAERYADTFAAFNTLGRQGIAAAASNGEHHLIPWEQLTTPIDARFPHIAAGTNYRAHAEEVGLDGEPFLFPKLSDATPWSAPVNAAARLDYEVELCAAPVWDYTPTRPAPLGLMLCGDFTDRWRLVRELDFDAPMGTTGFADAKGGATMMPLGALVVIATEADFHRQIELELYLNGRLRQHASAGLMIWSPDEIISRALSDCDTPYRFNGATVTLTRCDRIEARTIILTGTPAGVLFKVATLWSPWSYLRSGDEVVSRATYLGVLRNTIR